MKSGFLLIILVVTVDGFGKNVKYMPKGYKKAPKCPKEPPSKTSGGNFSVWNFLAALSLTTTIGANLAANVNSNNNNNNNNNNEDNQNTNNYNGNYNYNDNMNMNMITMVSTSKLVELA